VNVLAGSFAIPGRSGFATERGRPASSPESPRGETLVLLFRRSSVRSGVDLSPEPNGAGSMALRQPPQTPPRLCGTSSITWKRLWISAQVVSHNCLSRQPSPIFGALQQGLCGILQVHLPAPKRCSLARLHLICSNRSPDAEGHFPDLEQLSLVAVKRPPLKLKETFG